MFRTAYPVNRMLMVVMLFVSAAAAQRPPVNSRLLHHLVGRRSLDGMIAGQQTKHDVNAECVANHQYLCLHEVSRERTADGNPQYDAFIYLGRNEEKKVYSMLDNFWGVEPKSIGAAAPKDNGLLFLWKDEKGAVDFSNEFLYDRKTDSWQSVMDNVVDGTKKPFGRVKLTRVVTGNGAFKVGACADIVGTEGDG